MKQFVINVTQEVVVTMDESKYDENFMATFREFFYDHENLADHAMHLAQMEARNYIGSDTLVEGYGPLKEMGTTVKVTDQWEDVESVEYIPKEQVE